MVTSTNLCGTDPSTIICKMDYRTNLEVRKDKKICIRNNKYSKKAEMMFDGDKLDALERSWSEESNGSERFWFRRKKIEP